MLIATRFGLGIGDPAWFQHRLELLCGVTAPSLLAQEDQSFEWAIMAGPEIPARVRSELEDVLASFGGRAFLLPHKGRIATALLDLAQERRLVSHGGHILTGRIDDDDAWARRTVADVRARVARWLEKRGRGPGFGLTFEDGLIWIMYEMLEMNQLQEEGERVTVEAGVRPYRHPFTSMSGFVFSPFEIGMTSYSHKHAGLPDLLERNEFDVEHVSTSDPMWLYTRHKQAGGPMDKGELSAGGTVDIAALSEAFGIDVERVERYVRNADAYGYRQFSPIPRRGEMLSRWRELDRESKEEGVDEARLARLDGEKRRLREEWARLSRNIVGDAR